MASKRTGLRIYFAVILIFVLFMGAIVYIVHSEVDYWIELIVAIGLAAAFTVSALIRRFSKRFISTLGELSGKEEALATLTNIEQLQNELLRMSSIIHSSPNFVSYKSISGECLYINSGASAMTGFSEKELMEDYLGLMFDENSAEFIRTVAPLVLAEEGKLNYEVTGRRKDGEEIELSISSFLINAEEKAYGTVAADISEKKQIEAEKMEALAKAEHASSAKSEFLSRMSHEMRTPMNAIIGMTNIAKGTKDLEKRDYCLRKVDCAAKHLMSIISDILDMTNLESGELELDYGEFSYAKMITDTMGIIDFGCDEKMKNLTVNLDESIPPIIIGDERRLGQVVANLLSNALKFTPADGRVLLSARVTNDSNGLCTILTEVVDNGIGIPKGSQANLFKAFEQIDGGIARKHGGSGLGLAICKRIIDMMDGSIWVESESGQGSKFSFEITARKGSAKPRSGTPEQAGQPQSTGPARGRTVLIVEDVEINRLIIQEILLETGLDTECAENGRQALEIYCAQPEKYGLIIMDINMPEMDGHTATAHIRALEDKAAAGIPIIALTANVFQEDIDKCLEVGMNDHVGKPVNVAVLLEKLKKHINYEQ